MEVKNEKEALGMLLLGLGGMCEAVGEALKKNVDGTWVLDGGLGYTLQKIGLAIDYYENHMVEIKKVEKTKLNK